MVVRARTSKRNRKISEKLGVVDDEERRTQKQEARLEALEAGVADNAVVIDDDDDEFEIEAEDEVEMTAKGKARKKKAPAQRKQRRFQSLTAGSFKEILEESGIEKGEVLPPNYITSAARATRVYAPRKFCSICGNIAPYKCSRCGQLYCRRACLRIHADTRCLKAVLDG